MSRPAADRQLRSVAICVLEAAAPRLAAALLFVEQEAIADARPCPACGGWLDDSSGAVSGHRARCELDTSLRGAGLR